MRKGGWGLGMPNGLLKHGWCRGAVDGLPDALASDGLHLSGAAAVHIYLWDSEGGFLYGAGQAGADDSEAESVGLPMGGGVGFIFFRGCRPTARSMISLRRFAESSGQLLRERGGTRKAELSSAEEATIAFMSALLAKSPITAAHGARVARYAATTALALHLPEAKVCHVERCGLLHDIGKIGINEDVLEKPGKLTDQEWALMKTHPDLGVQILKPCRSLAPILPAIAMHHERYDGKGYPIGVQGPDIPLEARIVNICDAYDTMTSNRPYRPSLDPDEAVSRLLQGAGTQFDPDLIRIFTADVLGSLNAAMMSQVQVAAGRI